MHLGDEPRRALQPTGHVLRRGEQARRLAEPDPVELLNAPANRPVLRRLAELTEIGAVELVGLPELVHEPDALLGMPHEVRRELRRDDHVDPLAVRLRQVEEAPEEGLCEHPCPGVPLERNGDAVGVVPAGLQLPDERIAEDLDPAVRERHLGPDDRDPHRPC